MSSKPSPDNPQPALLGAAGQRTADPSRSRRRGWDGLRALTDSRFGEYLFVLPAVAFIAATVLYPLVFNVNLSFYRMTIGNFLRGDAPFIGLENYQAAFADPALRNSVLVSLGYTGGSLLITFVVGFAFALFFNRSFPGAVTMRAVLLLTWILPSVVSANVWRWMLDGSYGVINFVLLALGVLPESVFWLVESDTALIAVILATAWTTIPFAMVLLLAGLQGIPSSVYEAAAIDGAVAWRRFLDITLPMMRPVSLTVLLLLFINTFKTFDTIFIMTGGGPGDATQVLPIYAYTLAFEFFRLGEGAVGTTVLLVVSLTFALVYFWLSRREESY